MVASLAPRVSVASRRGAVRFSSSRPQCPHLAPSFPVCLGFRSLSRLAGESGPRLSFVRPSAAIVSCALRSVWPHLWLLLLSVPLAVPVRSGFASGASPFPLTGPLFAGLTEPVLSGRWCLPEGLFPTGVPPVWGMWRNVSSCVLKVHGTVGPRGGTPSASGHVCHGARSGGKGGGKPPSTAERGSCVAGCGLYTCSGRGCTVHAPRPPVLPRGRRGYCPCFRTSRVGDGDAGRSER